MKTLIGIKTTAPIARENQLRPLLVGQWKAILRKRLPELFERGNPSPEDSEQVIAPLHQKTGQFTVELDWLKKKSRQFGLSLRDEP